MTGLIATALISDFSALPHSSGNSGWAFLPAALCNQAADQQRLHRRHHREGPLHSQWGVAAPREYWGQATGRVPHTLSSFLIFSVLFCTAQRSEGLRHYRNSKLPDLCEVWMYGSVCICRTSMCPSKAVAWTHCLSGSWIQTLSARWRKRF